MKNKIKLINRGLLILGLFWIQATYAQHQFGAKLGLGISKTDPHFVNSDYSRFQVKYKPSAYLGLYYNYELNEHFYVGADLNFSQIEGRIDAQYYGGKYELDGEVFYTWENTANSISNYHLSYLTLPVYLGVKFKSFDMALGCQTGLMLRGAYSSMTSYFDEEVWTESNKSSDDIGFDLLDFGANIGLGYQLTEKWKIQANYYQGINDLLPTDLIVIGELNPWRNNQFTLGFSYQFF
ncbi:MAG: outer membrane beta-barrel protein [Crocinitomix sp.]|nr:outer membrane beta-barrel protein [Crocinitomix sp.]